MTTLNIAQQIQRENYKEYRDTTVKNVLPLLDNEQPGWDILGEDGWSFFIYEKFGVEPKEGQALRVYGSMGRPIVGVDLDGEPVFFKTELEQALDFAQMKLNFETDRCERYERDHERIAQQYDELHPALRARIDRFRKENPRFIYDSEPYEMFCLHEATKILNTLSPEQIEAVIGTDEADKSVPDLDLGAHTGNTHAAAWAMARTVSRGEYV